MTRFFACQSSGPGALNVDTLCQHGSFMVENMSFYRDAGLGTELTAEADWKRRGLYIGPQVCYLVHVDVQGSD